ncbi:MAG: hypothetical protein WCP29_17090 [Acidobacteriota bacterium]
MKVKKQHLQLAVVVAAAAIGWSAWSLLRTSGRPPVAAGAVANDQRPPMGRGPSGQAQSTVQVIDPSSIPAPPSTEGAVPSASTRDPFLFGSEVREVREAAVVAAAATDDPVVRSILYSTGRRLAVIENKVVSVGDKVGDFRVAQIERDAVTFSTPTGARRRVTIKVPVVAGASR